jgi:hypothetical protein
MDWPLWRRLLGARRKICEMRHLVRMAKLGFADRGRGRTRKSLTERRLEAF